MSATAEALSTKLKSIIRDVPDFPKPGIIFKDITPLLADHAAFTELVQAFADAYRGAGITKVLGIEARGFLLAAPIAMALGAGIVPVRKKGKLPYKTVAASYALEYGTDTLEMHADAVKPGEKVLVVDDVLATGGTAAAVCELVEKLGGRVAGVAMLIELEFLNGRSKLAGRDIHSLIKY
ncbi:MAG TPA: adenine phosphoribosyltransferase [Elusimicrobia bacterium]|nr:MAG: adenine phosphoribosyltransferase [Elusimicrobia bacterium GWA2_64_40]OGR62350.1 MAG: adenine phosphoribosyltransferase [Elusimicrobia bacterium GWB2_63_16]HAN04944.1 adenine phosphoribosyltransferase [Elusimicrobiota bacterium]HAU90007.1 adenine phosphoribosyltransferase [Elusimicrobiota bacterium]